MSVSKAGLRRWPLLVLTFGLLAVLTLALSGSASAGHNPDDLIGYWNFDNDTANDSSGHGSNGTLQGNATFANGKSGLGRALSLDGAGDYVRVPHSANVFVSNSDNFTVSLWFKAADSRTAFMVLKNANPGLQWRGTGSPMRFYDGNYHSSAKSSWNLNQWYHVAMVDDGSSLKLYVDGVLNKTDSRTPNRFGPFAFDIGAWAAAGQYFKGLIDEVKLHRRALSASELANLANPAPAFEDDFEGGLSKWTGKSFGAHSGVIVADPLRPGNNAVKFNSRVGAGDMFGTALTVPSGAAYTLSLEYLGTTSSAGGFAGYAQTPGGNHRWLAGVIPGFGNIVIPNDGQWHACAVTFNAAFIPIRAMLEDFPFVAGPAGNAYFDNVRLAPTAPGDATGCTGLGGPPPNEDPTVGANSPSVVLNEGTTAGNSGSYSDPDGDTVTLSASVGSVTKTGTSSGTWSWSNAAPDGPDSYNVTITSDDGNGGTANVSFSVTVNNVAPTVTVNVGAANTVYYVDWTAANPAAGTASGVINLPNGSTVNVTFEAVNPDTTPSFYYGAQTSGGINYWSPSAPYISAEVPNAPPTPDILQLSGGSSTIYRVTLSQPIVDPIMAIVSLGSSPITTTYDFDSPFTIVSQGVGYWGGCATCLAQLPGDVLRGNEGHGTLKFLGTFSTFSWTVPSPEVWHGFTFAIRTTGLLGNINVQEGETATNSGTWSDPGVNDNVTLSASVGNVVKNPDGTWNWAYPTTDGPVQSQTVTITATDKDNASASVSFPLVVNNEAPTVNAGPNATINEGDTFTRSASPCAGGVFNPANGHYYKAVGGSINWNAADAAAQAQSCAGSQGHLATVTSGPEWSFLISNLPAAFPGWGYWLGGFQSPGGAEPAGGWQWVTGDPFVFTAWSGSEPNNAGGAEEWIHTWFGNTWNDLSLCCATGYVVEFDGPFFPAFTDPGADTWTGTVNYGDGTGDQPLPLNPDKTFSLSHTYDDDGSYTVTVTVDDGDGGVGSHSFVVNVLNVDPQITAAPSPATIDENQSTTVSGSITDPGVLDTFDITIDWGEGAPVVYSYPAGSTSYSESHQYLDDNPTGTGSDVYAIGVSIEDDDGGTGSADTSVTVNNVAPVITSASGDSILEGGTASVSAIYTDVGTLDTHTATIDWGDSTSDGPSAVSGGSVGGSHAYGDNGTYTVTITVEDDDTGTVSTTVAVNVANVAPTLSFDTSGAISFAGGPAFLGRVNREQTHDASATDPGSDDLTFTWGFAPDPTTAANTYFNNGASADPLPSPHGTYPFGASDNASVTFIAAGIYTVSVSVTDDDGGSDADSLTKIVADDCDCAKSKGFWKKQVKDKGKKQIDADTMQTYLDIVNYASGHFSEVTTAATIAQARQVLDPKSGNNGGGSGNGSNQSKDSGSGSGSGKKKKGGKDKKKGGDASGSGGDSGSGNKLDKKRRDATSQALAAWLNFAKGGVEWDEAITIDQGSGSGSGSGNGAPAEVLSFQALIAEVEAILNDPDATKDDLNRAKELAESVNQHDKNNPLCDTGSGSDKNSKSGSGNSKGGSNS